MITLVALVEKIAHSGEFDMLGDVVVFEREIGPLAFVSIRSESYVTTAVSLKLRTRHTFSRVRKV